MNGSDHLVLFQLDDRQLSLRMSVVERIARAVEITPLPKAPRIILGVINVQGRVIPVVDIRKRFELPEKKLNLNDHLIVCNTSKRSIALLVDNVSDIVETPIQNIVSQNEILSEMEYIEGVVKLKDGMLLVHDLERLLSFEEEHTLEKVFEQSNLKAKKGRRKEKLGSS